MASKLGSLRQCVTEFNPDLCQKGTLNLDKWWKLWVENLECVMDFEGIEAGKKKAALLAVGGPKLRELFNTLDNVGETYDTTKAATTAHFVGTKNLTAERYKFFCMKPQGSNETHDHWITRLKAAGVNCEFDKMDLKEAIKLVVTLHTPIPRLQSEIIAKDMSFETLVSRTRALELMQREVAFMKSNPLENATKPEGEQQINRISDRPRPWGSPLLTHVIQQQHQPGSPQPRSVIIVERKNMWVAVAMLEEQHATSATNATILRRYVSQKAFIPCPCNTVQSRHPHLKSTISIPWN